MYWERGNRQFGVLRACVLLNEEKEPSMLEVDVSVDCLLSTCLFSLFFPLFERRIDID